jgi:protein-L-isoaspartate(D-aspartate) O-methyltransferase
MVDTQIAPRGIDDQRVLEAMRNVPRHWFVPPSQSGQAYSDYPLPIGYDQTISQPYIVALMTEMLELKPGEKVLEIGTGSGYQAAVLAELTDKVYTIEIVEPLARRTIALLKEKGYDNIHVRIGDGYQGWPEAAPFDAIIVTCAPESPPPPLVEQLAPGGRMCIPVGSQWGGQQLILLRKEPDGTLTRKHVEWVRFVPMTGKAQQEND